MKTLKVLHLEDSADDALFLEKLLKKEGLDAAITCVSGQSEFKAALEHDRFDLILSDYALPSFDGLAALQLARKQCPGVPFIFLSGTIGEDRAIESLKQGATDYVIKDRPTRLLPAIKRAMIDAETARKQKLAEDRLREQAALLDKAQDAICVNDMDHSILYWNKSAEGLYGWTAKEAVGRSANDLLFQEDTANAFAALKSLIRCGEWKGELQQVTKQGAKIIVESRWTLMRGENDEPKSILVVNTDITEKKQIERQLLRTQRMESIGALAGGIAHDLNNALAPVLMALHFVRAEALGPETRRMLDVAQHSAQRGVDMVKQILSFARGRESDHVTLEARQLIGEMVKFTEDTFPRSIRIQSSISPELFPIVGNLTQLHQVLLNLCINARDAMPKGGCLGIEAANATVDAATAAAKHRPPGPCVFITVSDTGCGMSPEVLPKIFEPFFTTKEVGKGTGLGLSTVAGIVKTHGGSIEVTSEVGKGSAFKIYLPAAKKIETLPDEPKPPALLNGHGETILLVDDEITILEVTRLLLESFDYKVIAAKDGAEAIALYLEHRAEIKAVVTDMMMPVMNGPETIRALRRIDPAIKVIGVSGLGSESVLTQEGRPKAQVFLKKPFPTEALLEALRGLMSADSH